MISEKEIEEAAEKYAAQEVFGDIQTTPNYLHCITDFTTGANWMQEKNAKEIEQLKQKLDKATTQLVSYEATIGLLKDALEEIANEDFRGNRSSGSVKAYHALQKIKPKISAEKE